MDSAPDFKDLRKRMIEGQLMSRDVRDNIVLAAFGKVPRHYFVPEDMRERAYADYPLPIGNQQTISQPYMAALMTQCMGLKGQERVLEIGTGSGYQTAILAEIAGEVYSVERIEALAKQAVEILNSLGYKNCRIKAGDGTLGWKEFAPYDAIVVTAGAPGVPESLASQLKDGGRLVIPIGGAYYQSLSVVTKNGDEIKVREVCGCVFVPLIGMEGWAD
jgi:protein-L-isoaspartate(D-aspartate) O-methyltransferase